MNEPASQINGAFLRQRREAKGWAQTDLATRACLSLRQVRQIEDGGNSSFYSESVKATAARKIATLLGFPAESAFVQVQADAESLPFAAAPQNTSGTDQVPAAVAASSAHPTAAAGADLSSVMTHVAVATADIDPPPPQSLSGGGAEGESRSSNFVWIALLAVAVGAGVLLMPKSSEVPQAPSSMTAPVDPNPPAPPPMVLPADAVEASGNAPTPAPANPAAVGMVTPSPSASIPAQAPAAAPTMGAGKTP